jgi:hypothetical protein
MGFQWENNQIKICCKGFLTYFCTPKKWVFLAIFASGAVPNWPTTQKTDDSVAQLVEQYTFNVWVLGSSPSGITLF